MSFTQSFLIGFVVYTVVATTGLGIITVIRRRKLAHVASMRPAFESRFPNAVVMLAGFLRLKPVERHAINSLSTAQTGPLKDVFYAVFDGPTLFMFLPTSVDTPTITLHHTEVQAITFTTQRMGIRTSAIAQIQLAQNNQSVRLIFLAPALRGLPVPFQTRQYLEANDWIQAWVQDGVTVPGQPTF